MRKKRQRGDCNALQCVATGCLRAKMGRVLTAVLLPDCQALPGAAATLWRRGEGKARTVLRLDPTRRLFWSSRSGFILRLWKETPGGSIYDFKAVRVAGATFASPKLVQVKNIDGQEVSLSDYEGKVVLIVNVASK